MLTKTLQKILYAEDEADIREIAKIALEDIGGFHVSYCSNGLEAVKKAQYIQVDLVILDVMMPELDGPAALKELRRLPAYRTVPAIFMTAKIQPDEIAKYREIGALDVITKPFDPMTLAEEITKIWERYIESCQTVK